MFETLLSFIFDGITNHPATSVFLATFLFGDEMVYFFAFLSGQGLLSLGIVIMFSILGNGSCDLFWFFVARSGYLESLKRKFYPVTSRENTNELLMAEKQNLFLLLLFSKFFYGTRLLTIFYTGKKIRDFKRIFFYNTLAVIIWVNVVSFFLWQFGKWTSIPFKSIDGFRKILGIGVFLILAIYLLNRFILSRLIDRFFRSKTIKNHGL